MGRALGGTRDWNINFFRGSLFNVCCANTIDIMKELIVTPPL